MSDYYDFTKDSDGSEGESGGHFAVTTKAGGGVARQRSAVSDAGEGTPGSDRNGETKRSRPGVAALAAASQHSQYELELKKELERSRLFEELLIRRNREFESNCKRLEDQVAARTKERDDALAELQRNQERARNFDTIQQNQQKIKQELKSEISDFETERNTIMVELEETRKEKKEAIARVQELEHKVANLQEDAQVTEQEKKEGADDHALPSDRETEEARETENLVFPNVATSASSTPSDGTAVATDVVLHFTPKERRSEILAKKWYKMFEELKSFKERNGHLIVPRTGATKTLSKWVVRQKQRYKVTVIPAYKYGVVALTKEEYKKLRSIGVDLEGRVSWDACFSELQEFKKSGGNVNKVPARS